MIKYHMLLCMILIPSLLSAQTPDGSSQSKDAGKPDPQTGGEGGSALTDEEALKWQTRGFQQARLDQLNWQLIQQRPMVQQPITLSSETVAGDFLSRNGQITDAAMFYVLSDGIETVTYAT